MPHLLFQVRGRKPEAFRQDPRKTDADRETVNRPDCSRCESTGQMAMRFARPEGAAALAALRRP